MGLILIPIFYQLTAQGLVNQNLVEIKVQIFGASMSYTLYNPVWNYERLTNQRREELIDTMVKKNYINELEREIQRRKGNANNVQEAGTLDRPATL